MTREDELIRTINMLIIALEVCAETMSESNQQKIATIISSATTIVERV